MDEDSNSSTDMNLIKDESMEEEHLEEEHLEEDLEEELLPETNNKTKKELKLDKLPKPIDCSKCKYNCQKHISEKIRGEICSAFWKLGDYRRQKDFILTNVKSNVPKRRRPSKPKNPNDVIKQRSNSKVFSFLGKRVCQSFFLKTLSISNGPLITAFEQVNSYTNFFDGEDLRGKHAPANKFSDTDVQEIVKHMLRYSSSTCTNSKSRKIIDSSNGVNTKKMYKNYQEQCEKQGANKRIASFTTYKRIFKENNFQFPRAAAVVKEVEEESKDIIEELVEIIEEEPQSYQEISNNAICQQLITATEIPKVSESSSNLFTDGNQIYEIQFIQYPQ